MASKLMPSAASVKAKICPVSELGMKPLGMARKRKTVATSMTSETSMTARRRLRAVRNVRSYRCNMPLKNRSLAS